MFNFESLKDKRIVLFGAGNEGDCAFNILKDNGVAPVCFCDNFKQGEKLGIPIISTNILVNDYSDATIIITALGYKDEILKELRRLKFNDNQIISEIRFHLYKQPYLKYYEINIVDHCNISCKGCSHFSPIAEERMSSIEVIRNDLWRMSKLTDKNVDEIHILGGEPLLHPDLNEILIVARDAFPNTAFSIVTNGVLLLNQNDAFWSVCSDANISIEVTKYPINLNYEKIIKIAEDNNVKFKFHSYTGKALKTLYKIPLDLNGKMDKDLSFRNCKLANRWVALMDGKMYTCQVSANAYHFNKKFGTNLELGKLDCIDIYDVNTIDEILSFLSKPKSFCKYCKIDEIVNGIKWQPSSCDISEWT